MRYVRRILMLILLGMTLCGCCWGVEEDFGGTQAAEMLPDEARRELGDWSELDVADLEEKAGALISGGVQTSQGTLRSSLRRCLSILGVVMLSAALRSISSFHSGDALELGGVLAVAMICYGEISCFFTQMAATVDQMTVFSGALFPALASASAATGKVGASTAMYAVTTAVCGMMSRGLELVMLPGISCYMALMTANYALGDDGLKLLAGTLKQLITTALKFVIIGFTAYLSLTGVISGSADSAAIRAAKLTISTAVPVVGSIIADASETLLVSAGLIRGSLGILGLLGVLAVSIGPFLQTGCSYLMLKCTAAASAATGEKTLSGLVEAMAGAVGLITAVTGVCTLLVMIGCVCFLGGLDG